MINKTVRFFILFIIIQNFSFTYHALGEDVRQNNKLFEQKQKQLIFKSNAEKKDAQKDARAQILMIENDKDSLEKAISDLKNSIKNYKIQNKTLESDIDKLEQNREQLEIDLEQTIAENKEFEGVVRTNAKDLKALMVQGLKNGLSPGNYKFLDPLINQQKFTSMKDLHLLANQFFKEIQESSEVIITNGMIVDRNGREQMAKLLLIGNFTGIYLLSSEVGFVLYSDQSQRYFALSRLPSSKITQNIKAYLSGESEAVYMDVSKGGAIRQMTHKLSFAQQIPKGGAIVWPILAILVVSIFIVLERIIFFYRKRVNAEKLMIAVRKMVVSNKWDDCKTYLESKHGKLIPKVLLTALAMKDRTRQDIENALQEAILSEIPSIERFLSTLGMLAAIAPLLGLLGTVTGMINTFHVITYYGTGDPRMMSGGISQALVTTMLGLSVAIPIMLAHTFLARAVETLISKMEEKSVSFVNMIFKTSAES